MATDVQIQYRRRTAAQLATFTPALAEIIVDTTNNRLIVGDGSTVGGIPLAKLSEAGGSSPTFTAAGIGTAADSGNPLSVLANTALFNAKGTGTGTGGTGDMRVKLNKAAAANTASLLFQDAFSGRAEVGLTADDNLHFKVSADGSTFRDALVLNASTGDAQVLSLNGGPLAGLRSRIINGNFSINQRAVTGTVTLAAGVYGHDRWKAGASGCTYTFAASGIDTTATISAGTLSQVIEAANMEGSIYTLSWSGSTQARVYQGSPTGSYAASPIIVTGLSANSNTVIEFNTGTLGKVQFEPGVIATPFERRPAGLELMLCQRYFEKSYDQTVAPGTAGANGVLALYTYGLPSAGYQAGIDVNFKVTKRTSPTVTTYSSSSGASGKLRDAYNGTDVTANFGPIGDSGYWLFGVNSAAANGYYFTWHWTASAEL